MELYAAAVKPGFAASREGAHMLASLGAALRSLDAPRAQEALAALRDASSGFDVSDVDELDELQVGTFRVWGLGFRN